MVKSICIFEDRLAHRFAPLTLTRPIYGLRCGLTTLQEKIIRGFPLSSVSLHCRAYLQPLVEEQNPDLTVNSAGEDECLFLNGRLMPDAHFLDNLDLSSARLYVSGGEVVAAHLLGENIARVAFQDHLNFDALRPSVDVCEIEAPLVDYLWDLVDRNAEEIRTDFDFLNRAGEIDGEIHSAAVLLNQRQICVGGGTKIGPGAVLDADSGPIHLGSNVHVMPNAVVEGPAFIGNQSVVKVGARIYSGTSIGDVCKVGGEVEASIIHGYSNKQHDGYLGHAYLGEWVNLGAGTNNSDLKNTYGSVKVPLDGETIDSGKTFVGAFVGDHAKLGINTMLNAGATVGVMAVVFGAGFPQKEFPSFGWGCPTVAEHGLAAAIASANKMMARRGCDLSPALENVYRHVFELTSVNRATATKC